MQEKESITYMVREAPGIMQSFSTYEEAFDWFSYASMDAFHDIELYCVKDGKYSLSDYHVGDHVKVLLDIEDRIHDYNKRFADLYIQNDKK